MVKKFRNSESKYMTVFFWLCGPFLADVAEKFARRSWRCWDSTTSPSSTPRTPRTPRPSTCWRCTGCWSWTTTISWRPWTTSPSSRSAPQCRWFICRTPTWSWASSIEVSECVSGRWLFTRTQLRSGIRLSAAACEWINASDECVSESRGSHDIFLHVSKILFSIKDSFRLKHLWLLCFNTLWALYYTVIIALCHVLQLYNGAWACF